MQWQQAYQASAQALSVANSLFTTFLDSINGTYTKDQEYPMRVTQNMEQAQFLTALNQLESNISTTQNGISTGLSFTTASQNPVGAGLVAGYNQVLGAKPAVHVQRPTARPAA